MKDNEQVAIPRFDPSLLKQGDRIEFLAGWDDAGRLITRGERVEDVSRALDYCIVRAWRESGVEMRRYFPAIPYGDDTSDWCYVCKAPCLDPEDCDGQRVHPSPDQ